MSGEASLWQPGVALGGTFRLVRENAWVKEWLTPWGERVVDPKTRWLGWVPTAGEFIGAWEGVDVAGRQDLRAALAFYPYELTAEIDAIFAYFEETVPATAGVMRDSLFGATSELTPQQQRFTSGLAGHLETMGVPQGIALECRFCRVLYNDAGFHLDVLISSPWEIPCDAELAALLPSALTPATLLRYRVVQLLRGNRELLTPAPGAEPFPGMSSPG